VVFAKSAPEQDDGSRALPVWQAAEVSVGLVEIYVLRSSS
jgi:hypothetical protein